MHFKINFHSLNKHFHFSSLPPAVPPTITTQPADIGALLGTNVTIVCVAMGDPAPVLSWRFGGTTLVSNASYSITSDGATSTLVVLDVAEEDGGVYVCAAGNDLGMATASSVLRPIC